MPTFFPRRRTALWPALGACFVAVLLLFGCGPPSPAEPLAARPDTLLNLDHLDALGETVAREDTTYRIIHIYAEALDYHWVGDDDEGIACVDDAARAAVVYLRHYEATADAASRAKAEALLRFVMYMQTDRGLFYNFVWDNDLTINRTHPNSRADKFEWWAARAVWALGEGARVLRTVNPTLADACARHLRRTLPHLDALLARYGQTLDDDGRTVPRWLVREHAADATSELLLGLAALGEAYPDDEIQQRIDRFAEGIALMQYGSMRTFPYGAHASWREGWHGWGNTQTQALTTTGHLATAVREADHFYPRLLVDGWLHSLRFDTGEVRRFEQIAYATRCVAVGLIRLYETTGEARYATLAGLAASWFTGNNVAETPMYDPDHGYGFDGITAPDTINRNAGAESTIEANFTLLEVERHPAARRWLHATGEAPQSLVKGGTEYRYRVFTTGDREDPARVAVVMNLTEETTQLLTGDAIDAFLRS